MVATMPSISRPLVHYTIAELEALALPDNGVRYELVRGQLIVSPLGSVRHRVVAGRLFAHVSAYINASQLKGLAVTPGAVIVGDDSELQPDVLAFAADRFPADWRDIATWWLAIEVLSPSTRKKDLTVKRDAYLEFGVRQMWFADPTAYTITIVSPGAADIDVRAPGPLRWHAPGAPGALEIDLAEVFADG